ncbi:hypothetical protein GN956_G10007 [Arapaima gigas]
MRNLYPAPGPRAPRLLLCFVADVTPRRDALWVESGRTDGRTDRPTGSRWRDDRGAAGVGCPASNQKPAANKSSCSAPSSLLAISPHPKMTRRPITQHADFDLSYNTCCGTDAAADARRSAVLSCQRDAGGPDWHGGHIGLMV